MRIYMEKVAHNRISDEKIIQCCNKLNLEYVGRHIRKRSKNHSQTMVQFICPNHRDKGIQCSPYSKLKNYRYGCPYCSGKYKTTTDFINQLKLINNDIQVIGQYHGCQKPITCKCKRCGNIWSPIGRSLLYNQGCPKCKQSIGENMIEDILKSNKIDFIKQKTFSECKYIDLLRFDFYIPSKNACIQYQGKQHYQAVRFGGISQQQAQQRLKYSKIRDQIKRNFCNANNILLIQIPYWEKQKINKYIENLLMESAETTGRIQQ